MAFAHVFASIPVTDRDAAVGWYERFFARPPDLIPNVSEAAWQVTDAGWIYAIVDVARAGSALHTLLLDDLDAFVAQLTERGIVAGPVRRMGNGVRHTTIADPDGNRIKIGQPAS